MSTSDIIRAVGIVAAMALLFLLGIQFGKRQLPADVVIQRDTLVIRDTTTLITYVDRIVYRTRIDTVELPVPDPYTVHDTVTVQVPIEYIHERYSDAEVWYHGFLAGIDSLQVYPETKYITNTVTLRERPSRWAISVQGGYGVGKTGLTPYVGVGISYDLVRFGKDRPRKK